MKNILSKIEKDFINYFISKIIYALRSIVLLVLYSYFLKPDIYGEFSLVISIINILIAVFIGWISSFSRRYYNEYYQEKSNIFFSNIIFIWLIMSIAISLLIYSISKYTLFINISEYYNYIVLIILFLSFSLIFQNITRAARFSKFYLIAIFTQSIIQLGVFYIGARFFEKSILTIFISLISSNIIIFILYIKKFSIFKYNYNELSIDFQKKMIKYGLPIVGAWAIDWMINLSDRFIIKIYSTNDLVGIYDMNYKIAGNTIGIFAPTIILAIFPVLIKSWKNNKKEFNLLLNKSILFYCFISIPSVLGLISIRNLLYNSLISSQYESGKTVIIFVSIGLFFQGLSLFIFNVWKAKEKPKTIFYITSFTLIVNCIINIYFIPKFGYIIASISTLIAYFLGFLFAILIMKEYINNKLKKDIFKILLASSLMFICIFYTSKFLLVNLWFSLIMNILLGILIYVYFIYKFGILKELKMVFKNIKDKGDIL